MLLPSSPAGMSALRESVDGFFTAPVHWLVSRIPYRFEVLLVVLAAATRFYHSELPVGVVFDETHFGGFVHSYHVSRYFFDIHPPLGKLTLLWLGYLFGYDPDQCDYKGILKLYGPECKYWILRRIAGGTHCFAIASVRRGVDNPTPFLVTAATTLASFRYDITTCTWRRRAREDDAVGIRHSPAVTRV